MRRENHSERFWLCRRLNRASCGLEDADWLLRPVCLLAACALANSDCCGGHQLLLAGSFIISGIITERLGSFISACLVSCCVIAYLVSHVISTFFFFLCSRCFIRYPSLLCGSTSTKLCISFAFQHSCQRCHHYNATLRNYGHVDVHQLLFLKYKLLLFPSSRALRWCVTLLVTTCVTVRYGALQCVTAVRYCGEWQSIWSRFCSYYCTCFVLLG